MCRRSKIRKSWAHEEFSKSYVLSHTCGRDIIYVYNAPFSSHDIFVYASSFGELNSSTCFAKKSKRNTQRSLSTHSQSTISNYGFFHIPSLLWYGFISMFLLCQAYFCLNIFWDFHDHRYSLLLLDTLQVVIFNLINDDDFWKSLFFYVTFWRPEGTL